MADNVHPDTPTDKPPSDDTTPYDDDQTDRAIEDIVAKESDTVLKAEDERIEQASPAPHAHRNPFSWWWQSRLARGLSVLIVMGGIAGVVATPVTRYYLLTMAGVRVATSVKTIDDITGLPLKGVRFTVGEQSVDTNENGQAAIKGLKLGKQHLRIEQPGFASIDQQVILGWGSNPQGVFRLKSSGARFTIEAHDYLTDKPIEGVQAVSGESTAVSDKNGKIVLSLAALSDATSPVTLSKAGYRTDDISLDQDARKTTNVSLTPAQKAVFISKQSGRYDLYKSDLDGKNPQIILPGTGSETSNISLAVSPDGSKVAVVSLRDNQRDSSGLRLSSLLIVNVSDGQAVSIAKAAQIQLIDWIGPRLVFEQVSSDAATPVTARYALIGYNVGDNTRVQLTAAKKLNAVFSAQDAIYYAVAADPADASFKPAFYKIFADGSGKQTAIDGEIWSGQRVDYNTFNLQSAADGWLSYDIPNDRSTNIDGPVSYVNRLYADNQARTKSLWIESQDGQGVLKQYDKASGKESRIIAQGGLTHPLQWVSDTIVVYRVVTGGEVADYAVSLIGGPARKISDVVNTYSYTSGQ